MREENSRVFEDKQKAKLLLTIRELKQRILDKKTENEHLKSRIDQRKDLFFKIERTYQDKAQIMKDEIELVKQYYRSEQRKRFRETEGQNKGFVFSAAEQHRKNTRQPGTDSEHCGKRICGLLQ